MNSNFKSYDSVVMHVIYAGQGIFVKGVTVKRIIELGDAIDRWIIKFNELKESIQRLLTYGLIQIRKNKVYVTSKYYMLRKKSKKVVPKVEYETDRVDLILDQVSNEKYDSILDLPHGFLTESSWQEAYNNYIN